MKHIILIGLLITGNANACYNEVEDTVGNTNLPVFDYNETIVSAETNMYIDVWQEAINEWKLRNEENGYWK